MNPALQGYFCLLEPGFGLFMFYPKQKGWKYPQFLVCSGYKNWKKTVNKFKKFWNAFCFKQIIYSANTKYKFFPVAHLKRKIYNSLKSVFLW